MIEIKNISDNVKPLVDELKQQIEGDVLFDQRSKALYSVDASNYRQVPVGVVRPRRLEEVLEIVRLARKYEVPLLSRGGGTSLAGQACNAALVLDFSRHCDHLISLDPDKREARVEPGLILDNLRKETEKYNLTFGADPSTHAWCTLGGMIGNNSCGIHSLLGGRTSDFVKEMDVVLYDGTRLTVGATTDQELEAIIAEGGRRGDIYRRLRELRDRYGGLIRERFPDIPRRVSGYNLDELLPESGFHVARALVGTEGSCATVLRATLQLVPSPPHRVTAVMGYLDIFEAADHVQEILEHNPIALEGMDQRLIRYMKERHLHPDDVDLLPRGKGWNFLEFGGETAEEACRSAEQAMKALSGPDSPVEDYRIFQEEEEQKCIWEVRESGLGATAKVPSMRDTHPGWEDAAVPPGQEGAYLRDFDKLMGKYGFEAALYGHFGQGCIHSRIEFDLRSADGIATYRKFVGEAADLVKSYGGSFSGEHGDGQARGALLKKMFGEELVQAFREFKQIWDPENRMNPGRVVDAAEPTEGLRLGKDYAPPKIKTYFSFHQDKFSFPEATTRCVGVGKCRKVDSGVMCPSYMVTREEMHSTRGRAHLLWEMFNGDVVGDFDDPQVKEALDLCLACKACKDECPVQVDMATYKAEFLAHYYKNHLRPRSAYAFGYIMLWARLASLMPSLANFFTQTPGLARLAKWMADVAPERDIPKFAAEPFTRWFERRPAKPASGKFKVLLWPDTFNNYFHPEVLRAAVKVLEQAGCRVHLPRHTLCCGRPLYDYGFLPQARKFLKRIVNKLRSEIRSGTPIVGLEPSCVSVFRDEATQLFPHDEDVQRLSKQTLTLSEFLHDYLPDYKPPSLNKKALLHTHCHHKAVLEVRSEYRLLENLGLKLERLDSGCCGMAGAFGFEQGKYEVSTGAGERVLLPSVREADPETLIVTNGFSCRTQIEQGTGRQAMHLAEVLELAYDTKFQTSGR
jgi:FAD/FMN-containing dehydrogenase/Fe-S oxidoreductase